MSRFEQSGFLKFPVALHAIGTRLIILVLAITVAIAASEMTFRLLLFAGLISTSMDVYSTDPYGFYLWSREGGHAMGVNNRFGYADQDFQFKKAPGIKRIAIIGDSFVEALQVNIPQKMGPVLQSLLNRESNPKYEVLSFGRSGEYPAYYLERLEKVASKFDPDIAFIVFSMGNDFRNASMEIENRASGVTPDQYIFYKIDPSNKRIKPYPKSALLINSFEAKELQNWAKRRTFLERVNSFFCQHFLLYLEIPNRFKHLRTLLNRDTKGWMAGDNAAFDYIQDHGQSWMSVSNEKSGSNGYIQRSFPVEMGATYEVRLPLRRKTSAANPAVYLGDASGFAKYAEYSLGRDNSAIFSRRITPAASSLSVLLQVGSSEPYAAALFGNLSLTRIGRPRKVCTDTSIYVKSYRGCWDDSVKITRDLFKKMARFARSRGIQLYLIGIPANETFWGDSELMKGVRSSRPNSATPDYDNFLAENFGVPSENVDLDAPDRLFIQALSGTGLASADLEGRFREEGKKNKRSPYCQWFFGHLSPVGHKIVAETMAGFIH